MFDAFERLNPAQREAVEHLGGPLLVVAGAGSGKTWTLACRVARLVERGVRPERILLLTFTRRAAREMLSRAERLTGAGRRLGRVWGGTFHAVANRLLRLHGRAVGLAPDFTVIDRADTADLMDLVRGELDLGSGERRFPRKDTLADLYSRTVNAGSRLADVLARDYPWCAEHVEDIGRVFDGYLARKRQQHLLDYDDLLVYWNALARSPSAEVIAGLFDHMLVDEYQDTNPVQADVLAALKPDGWGLMVVGDDAQAIYSFRAATVRNILEFPERFPGTRIVRLEQNYRSTTPILEATNAVIALSPERHEKTLWSERPGSRRPVLLTCLDEADQADAVCRTVLEHRERGVLLREQAVLFRAGHHSDLLEVELARRNIPFVKYGGLAFVETAHVKDALALLRVLENPFDEVSWFRVLQLLDGVGPATARRLMSEIVVGGRPRSPVARLVEGKPLRVPAPARPELDRLREALRDCSAAEVPIATQVERIRRFLEPVLRRRSDDAEARIRDLEQLEVVAAGYPTRERFVTDLALDPPISTSDLAGPPHPDEDSLVLSTIHSAKGGEWDVVYVIHAADGMIPSDLATGDEERIEEERRLLYVALTRARDALYVTFPLRYHRANRGLEDRHWYAQLTRFLPAEVRTRFEQRATYADGELAEPDAAGGSPGPAGAGRAAAVDALVRGLWTNESVTD